MYSKITGTRAASFLMLVQIVISSAYATIITSSNRDAWNSAITGSVFSQIEEGLGDETATISVVQSLMLAGSGIRVEVSQGLSDSVDDLGIDINIDFNVLSDDGLSISAVNGNELDLVLDNASSDPTIFTFILPGIFNAISFDYDELNNNAPLVYFSANNSPTQVALNSTLLLNPSLGAGFFGYVDTDSGFSSFTLTHSSELGGNNTQESFQIGRLSLSNSVVAVSEPGSLLLLLLGLTTVIQLRQNRRRLI